jgi:hypothetical protein
MAKTRIADVIEPSVFAQYQIERTTEKSVFVQSGIVSQDARITQLARNRGGRTINMPFWNDLTGNSEVLSDSTSLTPEKIDTAQDIATMHFRGKAWAANDLADAVAGDDPMRAIGDQVSDFWLNDDQDTLNSTLLGIFTGPLSSSHVNDIADEDGDNAVAANKFSDAAFLDTTFLLGDRHDEFVAMSVHSTIMRRMLDLDLIEFVVPSTGAVQVPTYRGRRVIVDDNVPIVAGTTSGFKYYSVLWGPGALARADGSPDMPVETDRDSLAGDDILITRRHFILHPRGVAWTGTAAGATPTNTELEVDTNWDKRWDDRNIRLAALVTNG